LVTALSVWTHLNEADARFYFKEISRVLKPDGKAIVTFFLLDEQYPGNWKETPGAFFQDVLIFAKA
jgi:predicted SAM-dependent methyltransferase